MAKAAKALIRDYTLEIIGGNRKWLNDRMAQYGNAKVGTHEAWLFCFYEELERGQLDLVAFVKGKRFRLYTYLMAVGELLEELDMPNAEEVHDRVAEAIRPRQ